MSDETTTILDYEGNEVKVGTKVKDYDEAFTDVGEVIGISDFDGDVDDDTGRSIMHPPTITVRWADGEEQEYNTSEWEFSEHGHDEDGFPTSVDATGKVEELMVVKDG